MSFHSFFFFSNSNFLTSRIDIFFGGFPLFYHFRKPKLQIGHSPLFLQAIKRNRDGAAKKANNVEKNDNFDKETISKKNQ